MKHSLAIETGRTVFDKRVKQVGDKSTFGKSERLIKRSTNVKLGKKVTRGKWAGMPILTLTLEERATCPRSCAHWSTCYGNNMMFATRYESGPDLERELELELEQLNKKHKCGFVVRLHVLGDFYSPAYVAKWAKWLGQFENLHVYGYTANMPDAFDASERKIGQAIKSLNETCGERWRVRFSGSFTVENAAVSFDDERAVEMVDAKQAFICPTQVTKENPRKLAGKGETTLVPDCGACGLCWTSKKPVTFLTH